MEFTMTIRVPQAIERLPATMRRGFEKQKAFLHDRVLPATIFAFYQVSLFFAFLGRNLVVCKNKTVSLIKNASHSINHFFAEIQYRNRLSFALGLDKKNFKACILYYTMDDQERLIRDLICSHRSQEMTPEILEQTLSAALLHNSSKTLHAVANSHLSSNITSATLANTLRVASAYQRSVMAVDLIRSRTFVNISSKDCEELLLSNIQHGATEVAIAMIGSPQIRTISSKAAKQAYKIAIQARNDAIADAMRQSQYFHSISERYAQKVRARAE